MSTEVFDLYVQQSLEKLESLWQRSNDLPTPESESFQQQKLLLQESLAELSASIEELQLACETLRQQNEELLASRQQITAEKQYYQQLFDSAPDCYVVTTTEGTIEDVNQKATELLGVSPQYLIRKSLAVFIAPDCRQEYYSKLNQLKRGKISEATWQLEIINRQKNAIAVECTIDAIGDCSGEATNLRWRITPIESNLRQENTVDLTSILINSLRFPLHNLTVQIEEIQAENKIDRLANSRRWQTISRQVFELQNTVDNGYILNYFNRDRDLNLSLIDYSIFIPHIIRQINERDTRLKPQIAIDPIKSYCAGISDVFLLKQIITNIINKSIANISVDSTLKIKLTKDSSNQLVIKFKFLADKLDIKQLQTTFSPLILGNKRELTSASNLEIAVIQKCVYLLQGKFELDLQDNTNASLTIKLPLVLNIDRQ